jgi:urea transport system permease protein
MQSTSIGIASTGAAPFLRKNWLLLLGLAAMLAAPLCVEPFRAQILGQYLCFAIAAVSLNLIWGYCGIMSLGHALFFGLGAYVMGYYLKLQDPSVPEFLAMNGFSRVPAWLAALRHAWVALPLVALLPAAVALLIGWPTFKSGIKGVYFTILSQALALAFYLLFINQQQYTGGTSGIYNYAAFFGVRASRPQMLYPLYYLSAAVLVGSVFLVKAFLGTRTGQVLRAIKNHENRVKFLGYDPVPYKVFAFALSAALAGIGGGLYALQVGSVYPTYLSINYSVLMAIWVVVGGLGTAWGPAAGAIAMSVAGTFFSENLPDAWWFVLGGLLIAIVMAFPGGLPDVAVRIARLAAAAKERRRAKATAEGGRP